MKVFIFLSLLIFNAEFCLCKETPVLSITSEVQNLKKSTFLRVTIKNNTSEDVIVPSVSELLLDIKIVDDEKKVVPFTRAGKSIFGGKTVKKESEDKLPKTDKELKEYYEKNMQSSSVVSHRFKPKAEYVVYLDLRSFFDLTLAGNYTVTVKYNFVANKIITKYEKSHEITVSAPSILRSQVSLKKVIGKIEPKKKDADQGHKVKANP